MGYTRAQFIAKLAPYAVEDMRKSKISAALTIAQGCLESADGNSGLTQRANNLFGIKGVGPAGSVSMLTTEYVAGVEVKVMAGFRAYQDWGQSVEDHSKLILGGVSWNRNLYRGVIGKTGREAARAIAAAGYATDPRYAEKLISIMDAHNLYKYDNIEEDEPMTSSEKKAFEELQQTVKKQAERLEKIEKKVPAPEWAKPAYEYYKEHISEPEGSQEFWRLLTIQFRKETNGGKK